MLIGGDVGQADSVVGHLQRIAAELDRPIYFVLGNHDYYKGSIAAVQAAVRDLCRRQPNLTWLDEAGVVSLTDRTALVGHGAWADGRYGDFVGSGMLLNDYFVIKELRTPGLFAGRDKDSLLAKLHRLGDAAAEVIGRVLPAALDRHRQTVLLTHVPPFAEACWHQGNLSDDAGLPHFSCRAVGDVLLGVMRDRPERHLTVLCGHTHSGGWAEILDNLHCRTARADYGKPILQTVLEIQ